MLQAWRRVAHRLPVETCINLFQLLTALVPNGQEQISTSTEQPSSGMLIDKSGKILVANRAELVDLLTAEGYATDGEVKFEGLQRYIKENKDVMLGTINGGHRREAKMLLMKLNKPLYKAQETLRYTTFHLYCGLSPPQARHISNIVNMTGSATVSDSSVVKLAVSARV